MYLRYISWAGILTAAIGLMISVAGAQTLPPGTQQHPAITVYVQASDARFDSYLYLKRKIPPDNDSESSDEFFYIAPSNSKEREREVANWRRSFRMIISAAALSERVQPKISHVKEEFSRADNAAECWTEDNNRERRITVTVIGSASKTAIENEYRAVSREFFADPRNFRCKYMYKVDVAPSTPEP